MKKNEMYEATCTDLTDMGAGIVKINDEVVFVYDLLPGEEAVIKIIKTYSKYAIGKVVERKTQSPFRQHPPCPVAKWCGGCQLQHVAYEGQCAFKDQWMNELFRGLNVKKIIPAKDPAYYRNKAQFPVRVKEGKIEMGFYKLHSNDVVDTRSCMIESSRINDLFLWIKEHCSIAQAEELRHVMIRNEQVVFIGRKNIDLAQLTKDMIKEFPDLESVVFNENLRKDNVILGEKYKVLFGKDWMMSECLGNKVKLHFKSFFQVNQKQMEVLYQTAIDLADFQGNERCVELYAGTGTIGMAISKYVKEVIGVEIVQEAVENANENVKLNGIKNCRYICQDATQFAKEFEGKCDVLIVDPPRKGLSEEGISHIERIDPKKVIYISCNPKTLKRDIDRLKEKNYVTKQIQPVDMFPYTTGIECVSLIEKDMNS